MIYALRLSTKPALCDWCGNEYTGEPIVVTVVTPRIVFREELCRACSETIKEAG